MKRFHFPLDSVLSWRATMLEHEEAKLQQLFAEQQRIVFAIERTKAEGAAAEQIVREQREIVSTDFQSLAAFRLRVEQRGIELNQRKAQQAERIEKQRQAVLEAERRHQLLARLRDRRASEWRYEAGRETETFAQEAFLNRWSAQKRLAANDQSPKVNE